MHTKTVSTCALMATCSCQLCSILGPRSASAVGQRLHGSTVCTERTLPYQAEGMCCKCAVEHGRSTALAVHTLRAAVNICARQLSCVSACTLAHTQRRKPGMLAGAKAGALARCTPFSSPFMPSNSQTTIAAAFPLQSVVVACMQLT